MDLENLSVDKLATNMMPLAMAWGGRILGVLVTLFVAWVVAGWLRRMLVGTFEKRKLDVTLGRFFANLVRYAVLAGAIVGCLGTFGIQTASFAALIAAMGLAVGLAFQGTLGNFASGAMLLVFRPFKVGDFVRAGGEKGTVAEIELFTTELTTLDNRRVIVPNGKIFGDVIENFSHHPTRRVDIPVGVAYSADTDQAQTVLMNAIRSVPEVLAEPEATVFLSNLGDSSVNFQLRAWVQSPDYWTVHQALVRAAKKHLEEAGISIPFPQMDVHLDK